MRYKRVWIKCRTSAAIALDPLITDDIKWCCLMRDYSAQQDYLVETIHDGRRGLERSAHGGFDLIILNLMLPVLDAYEVLRYP